MSCEIQAGYTKPCDKTIGGVSKFVVVPFDGITLSTPTDNVVTVSAQTKKAALLDLDLNSGMAGANWTTDRTNGTTFCAQTCMAIFKDSDKATDLLAEELAGGNWLVIAQFRSGKNKVFGYSNGLAVNANGESGTTSGDRNGYEVTFTGEEVKMPYHIAQATIDSILAYTS